MNPRTNGVFVDAPIPTEWLALRERVSSLPPTHRRALEPVVAEALEHARFRERVLGLAREAVEQFRLERRLVEFDLEATKREKAELLRLIDPTADD